jgi:ABC-2 type transport system permease protein
MTAPLLLLDHLAGLLGRAGVDYPRFRAILAVQLTLDGRRQHGWVQGSRRVTPLTWSLLVHGAMGLWLAALPVLVPSPLTALTIGLTVVMAMLAFDLVADYSALLLDPTQARVLAARPVAPRTIFAARLAHVGTYLGMYVGALAAGTCVTGSVRWGWVFLPAYLVSLLGAVVFVLAGVAVVYLVLMRVVSRERLRDATMYAQLAMTGLTVLAYVLGSLVDFRTERGLEGQAWVPLYPPAWMAGLPTVAIGQINALTVGLATLGVLAPAALLLLAGRLGTRFRVAAADDAPRAGMPVARASGLALRLGRWTTRSPAARAVFELVWALTARDRQFIQVSSRSCCSSWPSPRWRTPESGRTASARSRERTCTCSSSTTESW